MPKYSNAIDPLFSALADATRRQVVERLSLGPATVSELADAYQMALPSFMQHLRVLEQSGLVRSEKHGRVRTYYLVPGSLISIRDWCQEQLQVWPRRLNQLDDLLREMAPTDLNKQEKSDDASP